MTHLTKPVRRSTDIRPPGARRPLVVELREPGVIVIREAGRRTGYTVSLASVWVLGAKMKAEADKIEKAKIKAAKKAERARR